MSNYIPLALFDRIIAACSIGCIISAASLPEIIGSDLPIAPIPLLLPRLPPSKLSEGVADEVASLLVGIGCSERALDFAASLLGVVEDARVVVVPPDSVREEAGSSVACMEKLKM